MSEIKLVKVGELIPDDLNANNGTERGNWMLEKSIDKLGLGRSILLDRSGRIIAGNKTASKAGELGLEDVIIVETTGDKLVAVKRMDIDLDSPMGRELAIADNRVSEVNLDWNLEALLELDAEADVEMKDWFKPHELEALLESLQDDEEPLDLTSAAEPDFDPDRIPLAIVLDWSEKQRWDAAKADAGYKRDKDFLLSLIDDHG